jgi:hypothetical protein
MIIVVELSMLTMCLDQIYLLIIEIIRVGVFDLIYFVSFFINLRIFLYIVFDV